MNPELATTLLIGVLAEVTQGLADVQIPNGPVNPLSLWIMLIAESGEGKTPVLNLLRKPVVDFENAQHERYQLQVTNYEIEHKLWRETDKQLSSQLRKAVRDGKNLDEARLALAENMKAKPQKPMRIQLTYSDTTIEALLKGLCENWPTAALVSDEASRYLKGSIANAFPLLNQRWETGPLHIERSSQDTPIHAEDPRVVLLWAMQPKPLKTFLEHKGKDARELGTLARFIISRPPSTQGYRDVMPRDDDPKHLLWFHSRCSSLLAQTIDRVGEPRKEKLRITFSHEATANFFKMRSKIEEQIRPGDWLAHAKDYAAKASRQVARIAAIFELFENDSMVIGTESLNAAIGLMEWYTAGYINTVCSDATAPQETQDADKLYSWLDHRTRSYNNRYIVRNDVQKGCPRPMRNDILRLEAALTVLQQRRQIAILSYDNLLTIDMLPWQLQDMTSLINAISLHRSKRQRGRVNS